MSEIDKDFTDYFIKISKVFGQNNLTSRIAAILYLSPTEVAMDDIAKQTGYSLASVSNVMKSLEALNIVQRKKKPKTSKVFFYLEKNIFGINKRKFEAFNEFGIKPALQILPELIDKHKNKANNDLTKKKLKIIQNYYAQMIKFEKVMRHMIDSLDKLSKK